MHLQLQELDVLDDLREHGRLVKRHALRDQRAQLFHARRDALAALLGF